MNNNLKKILVFFTLLFSIYVAFCMVTVYSSFSSGLFISSVLKENFWQIKKNEGQYTIGIITPNRKGEMNQALMVKQAAENTGNLAYVYAFNDLDMQLFTLARYINNIVIYIMDYFIKTDFHLAMSFHVNLNISEPKMMYISVPKNYLIEREKLKEFPDIAEYNNFIDINLLNSNDDMMSELLHRKVNSAYGLVGVPANDYKTSNHDKLVLFGSLWGRKTDGLQTAVKLLAAKDYMFFIKNAYLLLGVDQKFTKPANNLSSLQEVLNKYGIALCVHSKFHVMEAVPSSRIFEIISSGAVAISDKNPFVIKYFGDNVLYFDSSLSAEEIFKQIDGHVRWLQEHPLQADEMAKNAHKILQENFTTEKFVKDIINFYLKIK